LIPFFLLSFPIIVHIHYVDTLSAHNGGFALTGPGRKTTATDKHVYRITLIDERLRLAGMTRPINVGSFSALKQSLSASGNRLTWGNT
jgi:hypothetical protein